MIELAPRNKRGLPVENPILLAGGVIGCGDAVPPALKNAKLGAAITGPILSSSRRGSTPPRLAEGLGGFVLETGLQNRGVGNVLKVCRRSWAGLGYPILAQVADRDLGALRRVAARLEASEALAGLELLLHPEADAAEVSELVAGLVRSSEMPLWVKLPFATAAPLAEATVRAGADALVVSQPPVAMLERRSPAPLAGASDPHGLAESGSLAQFVTGPMFGPAMYPLMLRLLAAVNALQLDVPLIACGGLHTWEDVLNAMVVGATAVQLDGVAWIEPGLADELSRRWVAERS